MAGLGAHPHGAYVPPHAHHGAHGHSHSHGVLPPGMPGMTSLPFGLSHGLESVGFQGMWGKLNCIQIAVFFLLYFISYQ